MMHPIYLDYAASTPLDPRVAEIMSAYLLDQKKIGNPASNHAYGQSAKTLVETARAHVADLIHAEVKEIIWTSGATESINLALKGAAQLYQEKGRHIVTLATEHKATLDTCLALEKQGFSVTYVAPDANGLLSAEIFQAALRPDTILVSMMHVHNEIGIVQDIATLSSMTASRGILFHLDAAQSAGKIPIDVKKMPVDLLSLSAHKLYGPQGVGALYVRQKPRARVAQQMHGGGQEQGMRSGTLATHQLLGMGEACRLAKQEMSRDIQHVQLLRDTFLKKLSILSTVVNGDLAHAYPGILNLRFPGKRADALMAAWPELAVATGSACFSNQPGPSYVLRALGQSAEEAASAIRFSFGRFTTLNDIIAASEIIVQS